MGYTHYFSQNHHVSPAAWKDITQTFKKVMIASLLNGPVLPIQREEDDNSPALIDLEQIVFNGIGANGHETMHLERTGGGFQFCKTARKPYDRAVLCLLMIADHFAKDAWEISSDGDAADWEPHRVWLNSLGVGTYELPARVGVYV